MKLLKFASTIVLIMVSLASFASQAKNYTIHGNFTGLADGTILELIPSGTHDMEKAVATATVHNGKFDFKGSLEEPRLFKITVRGHYGGCLVMVDNTDVSITAVAILAERYGNPYLDLKNLTITGSPIHDEYLKKISYRDSLSYDYEAYNKRGEAIMKQIDLARRDSDTAKVAALMKSDEYKVFESEEKAFFDKVTRTTTALIEANKESWWGSFLMLHAYSYFTPEQKPLFESLSKNAQESYYGQKIKEELFPKSFLGQKAPDIEAVASDQVVADLDKLISGQKYTLIDFWASWCAPCRKSIPALKNLYEQLSENGFQIVSISIDKKEEDWLKAEQEENLKWPSFLDKGSTSSNWKVKAIPAMFLLDERGVVIGENLTLEQIAAKIKGS